MVKMRGVSIVQQLFALAVVSVLLMVYLHHIQRASTEQVNKVLAQQLKTVGEATSDYLSKNYATLKVNPFGVILISDLVSGGFLPTTFSNTNSQGGTWSITWRKYGAFPSYVLRAMIETKTNSALVPGDVLRFLGSNSGLLSSGRAQGYYESYLYSSTDFSNISSANETSVF